MWYYVYVLYSKSKNKFYIGFTSNLKNRLTEHKYGRVYTTRRFGKVELVYCEASLSKRDAQTRERQLKTGFGRHYLRNRIKNYLMGP